MGARSGLPPGEYGRATGPVMCGDNGSVRGFGWGVVRNGRDEGTGSLGPDSELAWLRGHPARRGADHGRPRYHFDDPDLGDEDDAQERTQGAKKGCRIYWHGEKFWSQDNATAANPAALPVWMSSSGVSVWRVANIDTAQRRFDFGRGLYRGAGAVIARVFPDPATATSAQVEFALLACEATLNENVEAAADDDRAFFLSALFAIAAVCRADLHCRLRDSGMEDELNEIISNGGGTVIEDHDPSD